MPPPILPRPDWESLESWIVEHLADELNAVRLARQAGMSERTFARAYLDARRRTPADFVLEARVAVASRMLEEGQPIKRVWPACGFKSASSFRRAFKRLLGLPPGAWNKLEALTRPEPAPMADAIVAIAYAGSRYVACAETIDGSDAGKLLRVADGVTLTFVTKGWELNQYVDLVNVGTVPFKVVAADGINRAEVTEIEVPPDRRAQLTLVDTAKPAWVAWTENALRLEPNQLRVANDAGEALEGRTDRYSIGMDLVVEADEQAAAWRAPWPSVLENVSLLTRGGTAQVQLLHGPDYGEVAGFGQPVTVPSPDQPELVVCSGQPLVPGDWLYLRLTATDKLVPDADGVRGVMASLEVTRTGE